MPLETTDFSGWINRPMQTVPALDGDITCDVAIVGGGLLGLSAALRLAGRGVDAVVLEAEFCGWGASSRNAGQLSASVGDPQLLTSVHRKRAPALIRTGEHALPFTEALIERLGIECEYERTGNAWVALTKGQLKRSRKLARALRAAGNAIEFVDGPRAGVPQAFLGAMFERSGGVLNPGKLMRGLRDAALHADARVFERTAVQRLEPDPGRLSLATPRGRVLADRVLLATNAFMRDQPFGPKRVGVPLWVTQGETAPIDPQRLAALGWSSRIGIATQHLLLENYRLTVRNTIVFGTRRLETSRGPLTARGPDGEVVADLTRGLRDRFPQLADVPVERAWGGWISMTPSMLPVAGEVAPHVLYGVACNGHGLALAPYIGALLADRLAGDALHEDLRAVWRDKPRFRRAPHLSRPAVRAAWRLDRLSDRLGGATRG